MSMASLGAASCPGPFLSPLPLLIILHEVNSFLHHIDSYHHDVLPKCMMGPHHQGMNLLKLPAQNNSFLIYTITVRYFVTQEK